ncbi:MAG: hypothetical protein Ct9H90mP16_18340 [Candidatus Poseidoniales archaeon]|nr:MAG: hypothetical protein Ct9H90mP16_18340 [Candidatus Poseidoniales archaeon]
MFSTSVFHLDWSISKTPKKYDFSGFSRQMNYPEFVVTWKS